MSRIAKIINSKRNQGQKFFSPPLVLPVGAVTPETASQTMARLMLNSGVITRDDYEKMLGVRYDIENDEGVIFEDDGYDYEDDFNLSEWSEYERESPLNDDNSLDKSIPNDFSARDIENSRTDNVGEEDGKKEEIKRSSSDESNSTT